MPPRRILSAHTLILLILTIGLTTLDQVSKFFCVTEEVCHYVLIHPVLNDGVARGRDIGSIITIPLAVIACVVITWWWYRRDVSSTVAILMLAGTWGNSIDRVMAGSVRDFLVRGDRFVFNLADVYLTLGIGFYTVMIVREFFVIFSCKTD